jgi:hypothetical protein
MMSKNEDGDVIITLVDGTEEPHMVKFGSIDRRSRTLSRHHTARTRPGNGVHEAAARYTGQARVEASCSRGNSATLP